MNRRKLLTSALALGALSLLTPPADASSRPGFKTIKFSPFYSVEEVVKLQGYTAKQCGVGLDFFVESVYNWYTKTYTYKRLTVVTYSLNNLNYRFVSSSIEAKSVEAFFNENHLEYTSEIKGFVSDAVDTFNSCKNESFALTSYEVSSVSKYFKPTIYTIVPKRPVYELVNPRITSFSITSRGIEPDITYSERRNVGVTYSKCYVVNVPSDIMGQLSQIECSKDSKGTWVMKITKSCPDRNNTTENVIYSPIFEGMNETADKLISGQLGFNEYIFTQRVERLFKSIRD